MKDDKRGYKLLTKAELIEVARELDRLILALADRVHKQSELLSRRAEKPKEQG